MLLLFGLLSASGSLSARSLLPGQAPGEAAGVAFEEASSSPSDVELALASPVAGLVLAVPVALLIFYKDLR